MSKQKTQSRTRENGVALVQQRKPARSFTSIRCSLKRGLIASALLVLSSLLIVQTLTTPFQKSESERPAATHHTTPTKTPTTSIRFTDIAPRSRFAYRTNNGFTGRKYFVQFMTGGVAIFDNDGWPDIFFSNGARFPASTKTDHTFDNALLRNKSDGTFEDVTAKAGLAGVDLGYSFGASSDRRVHFGLGTERVIKTIEIRWPGGGTERLEHVAVDQILKVREPDR